MSNLSGQIGDKKLTWVCAGTSDVLTCNIYPGQGLKGVQVEGAGMSFTGAIVTGYGTTGAAKVLDIPDDPGEILLVGFEGFILEKITVSNIPAGTYKVKFSAI